MTFDRVVISVIVGGSIALLTVIAVMVHYRMKNGLWWWNDYDPYEHPAPDDAPYNVIQSIRLVDDTPDDNEPAPYNPFAFRLMLPYTDPEIQDMEWDRSRHPWRYRDNWGAVAESIIIDDFASAVDDHSAWRIEMERQAFQIDREIAARGVFHDDSLDYSPEFARYGIAA